MRQSSSSVRSALPQAQQPRQAVLPFVCCHPTDTVEINDGTAIHTPNCPVGKLIELTIYFRRPHSLAASKVAQGSRNGIARLLYLEELASVAVKRESLKQMFPLAYMHWQLCDVRSVRLFRNRIFNAISMCNTRCDSEPCNPLPAGRQSGPP